MGEAKDREKLGLTRKVHIFDTELLDFVSYLVARQASPQGQPGAPRSTANFDDRKRLRGMLKQLGAYEMYMKITSKTGGGLMISDVSPTARVAEMTVESIDYFLSQIREVPVDQAMRICELEERFTQAKQGLYDLPPELQPKKSEPATPSPTEPPPLALVPDSTPEAPAQA